MNNQIKEDMKSILDNRPELVKEVNKVAEVAGYLWQKGWAERNGGNITVNITEYVDDEIRQMPAISEVKQIGVTLPHLKGCYFYCKGTNMRMRDLARWPMDNGSVIRILDDCAWRRRLCNPGSEAVCRQSCSDFWREFWNTWVSDRGGKAEDSKSTVRNFVGKL